MRGLPDERRRSVWLVALPLLLFVVLSAAAYWNAMGDDLASSYVGCRVLATGNGAALYSHDPVNFAGIADTDSVWPRLAAEGGYTGYLHPYVQTPLWAWALQPLCQHVKFAAFKHVFLVLALMSIAGCVWLAARFWTPMLFRPVMLGGVLAVLFFSEPFQFAMALVQTHALLLLLTVLGLVLAERDEPVWAGVCLACAAAVKITPGVVLVYWIAGRRWRAALSFVVWSAVLLVLTRVVVGGPLFHAFMVDMRRSSQVLLVAENNQSLAAWWMGRFFSPDEVFDVNAFALPGAVRMVSMGLMVVFAGVGGLLDRAREASGSERTADVPLGAGITLTAMTIFAPIAWTHYFIVMLIPLMMLAQTGLTVRSRRLGWGLAMVIVVSAALLCRPLAPDVIHMDLSDYAVLRGEFFAGVLTCCALLVVAYMRYAGRVRSRVSITGPGVR